MNIRIRMYIKYRDTICVFIIYLLFFKSNFYYILHSEMENRTRLVNKNEVLNFIQNIQSIPVYFLYWMRYSNILINYWNTRSKILFESILYKTECFFVNWRIICIPITLNVNTHTHTTFETELLVASKSVILKMETVTITSFIN